MTPPLVDPSEPTTGPSDPAPTAPTPVVATTQVLVVPNEDLIPWRQPGGESRRMNDQEFAYALRNAHWRNRPDAEADETVRQVIPYIAVFFGVTGQEQILTYTRGKAGGEDRLHAKKSIGVGGHVDRGDMSLFNPLLLVDMACEREIREEIGAAWYAPWQLRRRGLLISDDSPVDRVHVGVTYTMFLRSSDDLRFSDASIQDPWFSRLSAVPFDRLERWSQIYFHSLRYGGLI